MSVCLLVYFEFHCRVPSTLAKLYVPFSKQVSQNGAFLLFLEFQILVALRWALGCEKHRLWVSQAWIQVQPSHCTCMTLDRLLKLPASLPL